MGLTRFGSPTEAAATGDMVNFGWMEQIERCLELEAEKQPEALRLMTHPAVRFLTALTMVLVVGPIECFVPAGVR